jgi:protease IV
MAEKKERFWDSNQWVFTIIIGGLILCGLAYFIIGNVTTLGIIEPQVYIIPVKGPIMLYGAGGLFDSEVAAATDIVAEIEAADRNPNIKAIILEINTGGGTVVASKEIAAAVENADKPVVAWMREKAASGGYWVAASCDTIVADPATMTGSIGVIGSYLEFSGLFEEYGIKYERLVSAQYKDSGSPFKELTLSERALLMKKIDMINEMFIAHVSRTRHMETSQVRAIATGEVFLGVEAKELGLVDVLGSKAEAIAAAEELAEIDDAEVIQYEKSAGLIERLLKTMSFQSYMIGRGMGDSMIDSEQEGFQIKS